MTVVVVVHLARRGVPMPGVEVEAASLTGAGGTIRWEREKQKPFALSMAQQNREPVTPAKKERSKQGPRLLIARQSTERARCQISGPTKTCSCIKNQTANGLLMIAGSGRAGKSLVDAEEHPGIPCSAGVASLAGVARQRQGSRSIVPTGPHQKAFASLVGPSILRSSPCPRRPRPILPP